MTYRLHWREDGYTSALEHRGEALLRVEPCGELLPGMWRIQLPDGRLSDFCNLSRIKDAARTLARQIV